MKMEHLATTCPLMEVVDVLCDNVHVVVVLEPGNGFMGSIGPSGEDLFAPQVIEMEHPSRVVLPSLRRGYLFDPVLLPQSITVPEGAQAALGAHTSSAEDNNAPRVHVANVVVHIRWISRVGLSLIFGPFIWEALPTKPLPIAAFLPPF